MSLRPPSICCGLVMLWRSEFCALSPKKRLSLAIPFVFMPSWLSLGEDVGEKGPVSFIADIVVFSLFLAANGLVADISISLIG